MNTQDFDFHDQQLYKNFTARIVIENELKKLLGILQGIECDRLISEDEKRGLNEWITSKSMWTGKEPFRSLMIVVKDAISDNIITEDEYDEIKWQCHQYIDDAGYINSGKSTILTLQGIITGITIDNTLNDKEILHLDNWLDNNDHLKNYWPYDELANIVMQIRKDGVITPEEREELLQFCISLKLNDITNQPMYDDIKRGYFQVDPDIIIPEKTFCLTGVSAKYKRREIAERIELYGGYVNKNITKDTHYLVVCDEKNSCWAYSCYGLKVEKAIRFRQQNLPVAIIHEADLLDKLTGMN